MMNKTALLHEAKQQQQALRQLSHWKRIAMLLSSCAAVLAWWGIAGSGLRFAGGVCGVVIALVCAVCAAVIGRGIRNGNRKLADKYPKVYAEKLLFLKEGQYSPNHFHWFKTEDIINRGGGNVLIRVYNSKEDESIDYESDVVVHTDGKSYTVPAGTQIRLTPGESIYVYQGLYHDFTVEPGTGDVLLGEVSQCNDDNTDNRFNPPMGRFPAIEEDEPPYRLLCNEYPAAK